MFLASEIGERLAAVDPARRPASYFSRQVRAMEHGRVLKPVSLRGQGRTAAKAYDYESLLIAKIGSQVIDFGLPMASIENIRKFLWSDFDVIRIWDNIIKSPRKSLSPGILLQIELDAGAMREWGHRFVETPSLDRSAGAFVIDLPNLLRDLPDLETMSTWEGLSLAVTQNVTQND